MYQVAKMAKNRYSNRDMKSGLFGKFFKSKETPYYTAVDLGSTMVRTAVFKPASELEELKILGMGAHMQGRKSMYGGQILDFDAVTDTLKIALDEANLQAGVTSNQVVLGLSGGLIHSKGLRVRTRRANPENKLEEAEFDVLAQQIEDKTLQKAQHELEETFKTEFTRVETSFTGFEVDGARVSTPIGLAGSEIEIAVLHYFIQPDKLRSINSMIEQLGLEIASLVETSVHFAVEQMHSLGDFVLLDIGGDATEVVVVMGGKVIGNEVLFIGGSDFTWQIHQDLNTSFENAENMKLDYGQGHLDQERARSVKHSLETAMEWWVEGVAATLSEFQSGDLPPKLLITGESRHLAELRSRLSAYPWMKFLHFVNFPKIEVAQGKLPNIEALTRIEL